MDADRKKFSMPKQLVRKERAGQTLEGLDSLEKGIIVLTTKNWRTLAGRKLAWKRLLLRRPRSTLGCRAT
ncbi:hypothetical protein TNCV_2324571 [Trichonephila clavipes]|nr:hypothetical protein TNCV_2324571 [Trichonephila clavipes]